MYVDTKQLGRRILHTANAGPTAFHTHTHPYEGMGLASEKRQSKCKHLQSRVACECVCGLCVVFVYTPIMYANANRTVYKRIVQDKFCGIEKCENRKWLRVGGVVPKMRLTGVWRCFFFVCFTWNGHTGGTHTYKHTHSFVLTHTHTHLNSQH